MPAVVAACRAPPGSSAAEWVEFGRAHLASPSSLARAAACFSDATLADPTSHQPALYAALALLQDGTRHDRVSQAAPLLRRAAALAQREGNHTGAVSSLRTLGAALAEVGDLAGASSAYESGLSIDPADCVLSASLANAHAARGAAAAAAAALRAALAEDHACVLAHHGLARLLAHLGDLPGALRHARASLELRPFDDEYERTLEALLGMEVEARGGKKRAVASSDGSLIDAEGSAAAAAAAAAEASVGGASSADSCGAPAGWRSPIRPSTLASSGARCGAPKKRSAKKHGARFLLVNPFEEGCFHDDLRKNERQQYFSCGQFNNVLASLLHALALSRILCRTLVLPGFYIRFGHRLTRVSPFAERWLPTSHFINLTMIQEAFDVIELKEWLPQGDAITLPLLHARAVGHSAPQRRFFSHHNLSFTDVQPATFPHFMQQQSELRWVSDDARRAGYFSRFEAGYGARWWAQSHGGDTGGAPVLAFDAPPSIGMGMDAFQWDEALRYTRGHVRYVGTVHAEAARVRRALFGSAPYLAIHIRRGADRLHDFCHTDWGKRCFGWNITMAMCYPTAEAVALQIKRAMARWGIGEGQVFLATDSPRPELFEDILRDQHGLRFARYGQQGPAATLGDEFALPVDQTLCAAAPFFLGNVPSTVTATIVQERDSIGWSRDRTDFFGFDEEVELRQFREGWTPSEAFAAHYAYRGGAHHEDGHGGANTGRVVAPACGA